MSDRFFLDSLIDGSRIRETVDAGNKALAAELRKLRASGLDDEQMAKATNRSVEDLRALEKRLGVA